MAYIVAHEQELIKEKSHADDVKAEADLHVLDTILSGVQTNFNLYAIDGRLREEYKTIEMLENKQCEYAFDDGIPMKRRPIHIS